MEKKKNQKDICSKIKKLSNLKKDFITEIFINLAKIDFRIKFLRW